MNIKFRKLKFALALCTLPLWSMAQNLMNKPIDKAHYLEMAQYTIKPDHLKAFQPLKEQTFKSLEKLNGLVAIHSYQDITKENQFIDLVIWETLEDAKAAEANFTKLEQFKAYNSSLEKVGYYGHANLVEKGQMTSHEISDNSIMEFVAYSLHDKTYDQYIAARLDVFGHLSKEYAGFESVKTWRMVEDPSVVIDIVFWKDIETAQKAFKASAQEPVFEPFNKTIREIKAFGDFKKVY